MSKDMKIKAIAPWFGCNRMNAEKVGKALAGCKWVGIVFAGGMPEVQHIEARSIVVNDKLQALINLARIVAHPDLGPMLYRRLRRHIFHPAEIKHAQKFAAFMETDRPENPFGVLGPEALTWAETYFVSVWMGRSAMAGREGELKGNLSTRWNANGGDSALRYHNAVRGLPAWRRSLRKCSFTCLDFRKFLAECKDAKGHGIYCDPPWVEEGDYKHAFSEIDHRDLAAILSRFATTKIVLRYGDHPLLRELYPADRWEWIETESRTAGNNAKAEVLIVRRPKEAK